MRREYREQFESEYSVVVNSFQIALALRIRSIRLELALKIFIDTFAASVLILHFTVRPTPNNAIGLGVFAGVRLFEGQLLDEYFGELIPPRMASERLDDNYMFQILNVASSSARDYGNWTRFVNHSCRDFNVEAVDDVLGGRRTITFRAIRNIKAGEQLLIDYGINYFGDADGEILCRCPAFPEPHLPPRQENRAPQTKQAFPGARTGATVPKPADVSVPEQNQWLTRNKAWLGEEEPNGSSRWTMVHWRVLERLIRRRREWNVWRNKEEFINLPTSRGDPLIKSYISGERSQLTIMQWHLDVVKAFQRDRVCGTKQGTQWETKDLLKRIFAVLIAVRRRKGRAALAERRAGMSPSISEPETPERSGTATGHLPTPPSTVAPQRSTPGDFPNLPSDAPPPAAGVPAPPATIRAARRASARRRRQRRSYSP